MFRPIEHIRSYEIEFYTCDSYIAIRAHKFPERASFRNRSDLNHKWMSQFRMTVNMICERCEKGERFPYRVSVLKSQFLALSMFGGVQKEKSGLPLLSMNFSRTSFWWIILCAFDRANYAPNYQLRLFL